ncbi:hypothetical protein CYY_000639 [Polysphondylium violaceum]|uniref:Uncharacterized protein n=1 Tax=Polysphondylium violaceum TaxID=133409 RepID=A0A8J4V5E9_9MYCE|nr:hypothetical protein CYY_000639 [Polysphondylium violaceum]
MDHSKIKSLKRDNFTVDSASKFTLEEIPKSSELWLFKIPKHFDIGDLPKKLALGNINNVNVKVEINDKKYNIHQGDSGEISSLFNIFGQSEDSGSLSLGKPFTKLIQVDEHVELPTKNVEIPPIEKPKQQHEKLKGHFNPPGSSQYLESIRNERDLVKKTAPTKKDSKKETTKKDDDKAKSVDKKEKDSKSTSSSSSSKDKKKKVESSSESSSSEDEKAKKKASKKDKDSKKDKKKKQDSSSEEEQEKSKKDKKSDKKDNKRKKDEAETQEAKKKKKTK